jgi:magnesium transporter
VSSGESASGEGGLRVPCLANPHHDEVAIHLKDRQFVWVDLQGPQEEELGKLADLIGLHPLTIEDAHTFRQRPKLEEYDGYLFMVVFGVDPGIKPGGPLLREVHMIISGDYVVTIHKTKMKSLDELRSRYNDQVVRSEQFLVYKILDAITSTFVPVLSRIDEDIDEIEQEVIADASATHLQRIFSLKRDLISMRRVVSPMRDIFARGADTITNFPGLSSDDRLYYRDLYDSLIRTTELVDSYRDLLSGATDMYLSTVANRQGEINKQLTIIATIFLPLTFLTGFFGQNFSYMIRDLISSTWSFYVFGVGLLLASVVGFAIYFRQKRWY